VNKYGLLSNHTFNYFCGAFVGAMAGMLGIGGGIIYVPAISHILSHKQIEPIKLILI